MMVLFIIIYWTVLSNLKFGSAELYYIFEILAVFLIIRVSYRLFHCPRTVWLRWIATLYSRFATPPPLWEKYSSSFIFLQFMHWNVDI